MNENSPLEINEFARAKNPLGERFVLMLPLNRKRTSFSLGNTCEDDAIFSLPKHAEPNSSHQRQVLQQQKTGDITMQTNSVDKEIVFLCTLGYLKPAKTPVSPRSLQPGTLRR